MSERESPPSAARSAGAKVPVGLELRLEHGQAYACLADRPFAPGARLVDLRLEVPEVRFPFDVGLGAAQFRRRLCNLVRIEISLEDELLAALAARLDLPAAGLAALELAARAGFVEGAGDLEGGVPFTFKAGLEPHGAQAIALVVYDARFFGPSPLPSAGLPSLLARAAAGLARQDGSSLVVEPLPALLRRLLPPRGWKIPRSHSAPLAQLQAAPGRLAVAWDRAHAGPAQGPSDPERLAAVEGARAFRAAEVLVARGEWDAAREAYLSAGAATSHPFAAARLLSLLVQDERFHDEALDVAAHWLGRRPDFAPALLAEGLVRAVRGESARAARALADLAASAARRGEAFAALRAAEACFALGAASDPAAVGRAVESALSIQRDHLPALRTLLEVADHTQDREAMLRACRRLAAHAPDGAERAGAHARLAEMLLRSDAAAARLHLDQALRLAPGDESALGALARACEDAGEFLRAVRVHDRLRELHHARGDLAAEARAAVAVGALWEEKLGHPDNALLRYREACDLAPSSSEARRRAARAAHALGQWTEAADHYAALLAGLDPGEPGAPGYAVEAHRALARIARERLDDRARAASHLEAALALEPHDVESLEPLADLYRSLDRPAELLATLDRLAPLAKGSAARAALLAEAGLVCLRSLSLPEAARSRFGAALALDPQCRPALEGVAQLAADRRDAQAEREALARLALLARDRAEEAALYDRLAQACERAGDLEAAGRAAASARRAEPTLARLAEALRIARAGGDRAALADLLGEMAAATRAAGDASAAAAAFAERAQVLAQSDPGQALAALSEARTLSPGDPEILRAQADLAVASGDHLVALSALRALLTSGALDSGALELRAARAALGAGDARAAREHAERATEARQPGGAELLAEILEVSGDRAARAEVLERAGRWVEAASLWRETGAPDRARAALERAASHPASADEALPLLVESRLAAGDRAGSARALLDLARRRGRGDGARLAWRAAGLDPALELEALDLAVRCDPSFAPARAARAERIAEREPAQALEDCQAALEAPPGPEAPAPGQRTGLLRLAARLAVRAQDRERARRFLAEYAALAPGDDEALGELAALHRAAGDLAALSEALARRISRGGPGAEAARLELARLELDAGRATEASELLRESLRRDARSAAALDALVDPRLGGLLGAPERAELLGRLSAAAGLDPRRRGRALAERARLVSSGAAPGGREAALAAAREALGLAPGEPAVLELAARLESESGDPLAGARALLARARAAREGGEAEAAELLAAAGHAALAVGLAAEGEAALRSALALGLDRDEARPAWIALAARAREAGDAEGERAALSSLTPLLPTGERPPRLARLAALELAAGNPERARAAAEEARALAPRDAGVVEVGREVAGRLGDREALAARLAELAALDPARSGAMLLERARLLAGPLGRPEEADDAYGEALSRLPPDPALAAEHARLRREAPPPLRLRPWSEPLERFAARAEDARAAASALRDAAYLALAQDDAEAALRCARRAYGRSRDDPGFAGPLFARVLYRLGGGAEALVLHRNLLESGFPGIEEGDVAVLCRQLAELAEDAGEIDLALRSLDRLLELRPQDLEAAEWRFRLDPNRARAVRLLSAQAGATRSARRRARALALAAAAAHRELADPALADATWRRARSAAADHPSLLAELEMARLEPARRDYAPASPRAPTELLDCLGDAAAAWEAAGDAAAARALLEEAVELETRHGLLDRARARLAALERSAAGDGAAAAGYARALGTIALEQEGDLAGAEEALRRAVAHDRRDAASWSALEQVARRKGAGGVGLLAEVLRARADLAESGTERAERLVAQAQLLAGPLGDPAAAAEALREAVAVAPGLPGAETELERLLRELDRPGDLGRLLADRVARAADPAERDSLRREAAAQLERAAGEEERALGARLLADLLAERPDDAEAARRLGRLLVGLGRGEEAIPHLAALVRADPDDEEAAAALAEAYAGRHRERAELFLDRAGRVAGEARAAHLREAAKALFAAGEDQRARQLLRQAFEAWPSDDAGFLAAVRDAAADVDRLDAVLRARAAAVPADAAGCHRARADALLAFGREEAALEAYRQCLRSSPDDVAALAAVASMRAEREGAPAAAEADARICALADAAEGAVVPSLEAPSRFRLGFAAWSAGRPEEGITHLERALSLAPQDERAGLAWAALASGHAARGDGAAALGAARRRAERADRLGLAAERREALEAGAALAAPFGDGGEDAAALLESLAALRLSDAEAPDPGLDALVERAAAALGAAAEPARAEALLALAARRAEGKRRADLLARISESARARGDEAAARATRSGARAAFPDGFLPTPEPQPAPASLLGQDPLAAAAEHARRAQAAESPGLRAAELVAAARALERAGAPDEEVRASLERACDADPDELPAWQALAGFESRRGEPLAAARAHLAVAIRAEGEAAALAALEAARIFEAAGRPADALRAYGAVIHSRTGNYPARRALAQAALEKGDAEAAVRHLQAVDPAEIRHDARVDHSRELAAALSAAGREDEAAPLWEAVFASEPHDEQAFDQLASRTSPEPWLELAARHDAALAVTGHAARRRDLRCERARVLAGLGRLEAAEGAWRAALDIDPEWRPAQEGLAELAGRRDEWAAVAEGLAADAAAAGDPSATAALLLRRGHLLHEKLGDPAGAAAVLEEAAGRAREAASPAALRVAGEAERLLVSILPALGRRADAARLAAGLVQVGVEDPELAALAAEADPSALERPAPPAPPAAPDDAVAEILRAEAEAARGEERAALFERLAGHLERAGDRAGAADALLEALASDPSRELSFAWFLSLAEGDPGRLARGHRLRAGTAPDAPSRAAALADLGLVLLGDAATRAEGVAQLEKALGLDPANDAAAEGLARAWLASGEPERALPLLERLRGGGPTLSAAEVERLAAEARASSGGGARGLSEAREAARSAPSVPTHQEVWAAAAEAASAPAEAAEAWGAALTADPEASPADAARRLLGQARALEALGRLPQALDLEERAAALSLEGRERAEALAGIAARAEALGDRARALRLLAEARARDPQNLAALGALCRIREAEGDGAGLLEAARALEAAGGPEAVAPFAASLGRAHAAAGEWEPAYARLKMARGRDPSDLEVARELGRAAERLGHLEEALALAEEAADAVAPRDAAGAAARYREQAEAWRGRLSDPARAAALLRKALAVAPGDAEALRALEALEGGGPAASRGGLEGLIEAARQDPGDAAALGALAAACRELQRGADRAAASALAERARAAASLGRFAAGDPGAEAAPLARRIPRELAQRASAPGALGPMGRLVSLLAPWLEPLFPADLGRRGVGPSDRLGPGQAPSLQARVEAASRVLGARPLALFLAPEGGAEIALENTQPPALVVGARALDSLTPGGLSFLVGRALELLRTGWTLLGKFAPRDVAILGELASHFAGGTPPALGLPAQRADAFLAALGRTVPPEVRREAEALGKPAAEELRTLDPRAFVAAVRRSANRVALLYAGDPHGALLALARSEKGLADGSGRTDRARALQVADLRDLALFALSDPYAEMRSSVVG